MAANYLATTDVDPVIGAVRRQALFTDPGGSYTESEFTRACELASAQVKAAAHNAGYTGLGDTTTSDVVVGATLRVLITMAYARKGEKVPEGLVDAYPTLKQIKDGDVHLPGLAPVERDAVGGSYFSESSTSVTDAQVQVFTRAEQNVY